MSALKIMVWLRRHIVDLYEVAIPWDRCARRNMIVAAFGGGRWDYGDPKPELPLVQRPNGDVFTAEDAEYTWYASDGREVHVSLIGGGLVGKRAQYRYPGPWMYLVESADGVRTAFGDDFRSSERRTHEEVARTVLDMLDHAAEFVPFPPLNPRG